MTETYGILVVRERQLPPLHIAIEQRTQQARQDGPLRDARLLSIEPPADLYTEAKHQLGGEKALDRKRTLTKLVVMCSRRRCMRRSRATLV